MGQQPPYKIAVAIPKYGLVGGAEGFAAELTERIAQDERYDVHVFANTWTSISQNITFHRVPIIRFPKFLTTPSFAYFAGKAMEGIPFDLIHAHDRIFETDIYTLHGIPHRIWVRDVRGKKRMSLFDRATCRVEQTMVNGGRCRRFLAVSTLSRDLFLREFHVDPDHVPVVHPGIKIPRTDMGRRTRNRDEIRGQYGILPDDTLILFVSMNFEIKGLDAVIAGLGKFCQENREAQIKLLVVGKGDVARYKRLARDLGISDRVIFTGVVDKPALEKIYDAGDLYAMLSRFDTFGLVILEAMAASLPVLISGNVGAKDVVEEGVNGFIVEDTSDVGAIAGRLSLLFDERTRASMAKAARETACRYSWEETTAKVKAIYEELLQEKIT